jgi:hypothetical protein
MQKPQLECKYDPLIDEPAELAIAFANVVTIQSGPDDWVARNGNKSIFAVLYMLLPEVAALPQAIQLELEYD